MVRILRLRFPKPRTCLGFIDLQTAVEVITIFTLVNKVSGFYGILSIFTGTLPQTGTPGLSSGAEITALQMSMYIWSIFGTIVCLWALNCVRHVRSPHKKESANSKGEANATCHICLFLRPRFPD